LPFYLHSYVHYLIPDKVKLEQNYLNVALLLLAEAVWYSIAFVQEHGRSNIGGGFNAIEQ